MIKLSGCRLPEAHQSCVNQANGILLNIISLLSAIAIVKTMSLSRWTKALKEKKQPPKELIQNLADTTKLCKDMGLNIPGELQAAALSWTNQDSSWVSSSAFRSGSWQDSVRDSEFDLFWFCLQDLMKSPWGYCSCLCLNSESETFDSVSCLVESCRWFQLPSQLN